MNLGNRFVYLSCDYLFLRTEIKEDLSELKSRLDSIQERLAPDRQYAPEIALDDWNTLAGNDAVTVGTFFRSALIKEILRQNNGFDNVSFCSVSQVESALYQIQRMSVCPCFCMAPFGDQFTLSCGFWTP